ncbi:acyl-CoA thioesterase [Alkalibacillus salilacus]|uniref:Acyl-CoA thioester hydrolase n=1 Tax=Alkalibacillus salilacus TaxID=284582 RepID=A0ABT9VD63_9BACI|nr:acyl-CoA thioesterase [Alkalibacillus salilacus]MDQ0158867.1 acyl-CoA thioester hydrolase [Alkalibacillus salilacus]
MKTPNYIEEFKRWKESFSFYIPIDIRFSETDMFGHVNNVSPFIYFEQARIEYMNKIGLFGDLDENTTKIPVVSDLQCDYLSQIYFGEQINVFVKTAHIGNTSIDIHYMATNEKGDICLAGRGRVVQIHAEKQKPEPFSEDQLERLQNTDQITN